jgi:hypothetical protein
MNGGACKPIETAADVAQIKGEFMQLAARAALAAGYKVDLRNIRYEWMIYANGKHFHPFTNWEQCVRLIVDTSSSFSINNIGQVYTEYPDATTPEDWECRTPTTDAEYRIQMCNAVVTNVAKGFPV